MYNNPVCLYICMEIYVCVYIQYVNMTDNKLLFSAFWKGWVPGSIEVEGFLHVPCFSCCSW